MGKLCVFGLRIYICKDADGRKDSRRNLMQKDFVLSNLALRQRSGELPAGRSHFPTIDRGGRFISFVRPVTDFTSGNMVECLAQQTLRPFEYFNELFSL